MSRTPKGDVLYIVTQQPKEEYRKDLVVKVLVVAAYNKNNALAKYKEEHGGRSPYYMVPVAHLMKPGELVAV